MPESLAHKFRAELDEVHRALVAVPADFADMPWREGGWTRKQIVGHLLDSAANNRQRFVRAAVQGKYVGLDYAQDAWVAAHGYAEQSWGTLRLVGSRTRNPHGRGRQYPRKQALCAVRHRR